MEKKLRALKLVLDALDISPDIATLRDRKRVQKAIYLAQVAGADLGYRYNWYVYGPYSPALTRDYFRLEETLVAAEDAVPSARLHPKFLERLERVKQAIEAPHEQASQEDWLELLASVHYQMHVLGKNEEEAKSYLREHPSKGRLSPLLDQAFATLQASQLID